MLPHVTTSRPASLLSLLVAALALGPFVAPGLGQGAPFARAAPAGGWDLLSIDETTGALSLERAGAQLLPLELAGHARRDRLRADRPREAAQGPAATIRLPDAGSLYRVSIGGATELLQITTDGSFRTLLSATDIGGTPALLEWVSVSDDGTCALAATTAAAGGNAFLLDLVGGLAPVDLTASVGPLTIEDVSLRVGPEHAWFVCGTNVHHADLALGTGATPIALPLDPGETLLPELALASDTTCVALVGQQTTGDRHVYTVDATGVAQRITTVASDYDPPTLDGPIGPLLALAPDGGFVAWRRTIADSKELFVRPVPSGQSTSWVTADAQFDDTIDNVGILGFIGAGLLLFAAGEQAPLDPEVAVGSADVFLADSTGGGAPVLTNLTLTSGQTTAPYTEPGALEVKQAFVDPLAERLVLHVDPSGGDDALFALPLDGSGTLTPIGPPLQFPPNIVATGDTVLIDGISDAGGPNGPRTLWLLPPAAQGGLVELLVISQLVQFDRFAPDRTGRYLAGALTLTPDLEIPILVDTQANTIFPLWNQFFALAPAVAFTPAGRIAAGLGLAGGPYVFAAFDAPLAGQVYPVPVGVGFPLAP